VSTDLDVLRAGPVGRRASGEGVHIWVDIDNAPQVLVLNPIMKELERRGFAVQLTARDFGQTFPLLLLHGLLFRPVGRHAGRNLLRKGAELLSRSFHLWRIARGQNFRVVVSCGARASVLPARMLGVPLVVLLDYEHVFAYPFRKWARLILTPEVMPDEDLRRLGFDMRQVRKFPGLKEELYVFDFQPDRASLEASGIDLSKTLVALRPPATMAHYHSPKSEELFWAVLQYLLRHPDVQTLVLPRTESQGAWITEKVGPRGNLLIPENVLNGSNLLWHADLMIGGGGTMNREAACLGVPAYSFFGGHLGAVDRYLIQQGKLSLLRSTSQVEEICLRKRPPRGAPPPPDAGHRALNCIVDSVLEVALN